MLKTIFKSTLLVAVAALLFASCDKDENQTISLNITGLEDLGADFVYEGWIMVDGAPQTAGIFSVDANGTLVPNTFDLDKENVEAATAYILTIEPANDPDPAPSSVHVLAGDFSGTSADLSVSHSAAIGTDFTASTGGFILATPTTAVDTDERSGVWFLDGSSGTPEAALDLPTLPEGWAYEGWVVIDGTPLSTGRFTSVTGSDDAAPYSGTAPAPPFPGEDFVLNAPAGFSFPTNLDGGTVVISVEPVPDNSPAPFALKPLVQSIDAGSATHSLLSMGNNAAATNPVGKVTR